MSTKLKARVARPAIQLILGKKLFSSSREDEVVMATAMRKLRKKVTLETIYTTYTLDEIIGEGGAGRVYGGVGPDETQVAVKVLSTDKATSDKRRRFKNEIAFLEKNTHRNIVSVIDHGISHEEPIKGPFYVMPRYQKNLRVLMNEKISPDRVLPLFIEILDGVEAAHLQDVTHRDLKPENILYHATGGYPLVADFGIARFTEHHLITQVETSPNQKLANFEYAAPE
jgi:serine/threonine protein kinase